VDTFLFFQLVPLAFTGSAVLLDASAPSTCDAASVDLRRRCTQPAGSDGSKEENHQEDSSLLQIKKSTAQVTSLHKFKENWWTSQHRTTANDMKAFSHISHNVDCDVREAAKWYSETLGFVDAYNIEDPGGFGSAYWPKMGNTKDCIICVDICSGMGATDGCLADFKWIWHPGFNLYFELIQFHVPKPKKLETGKAWDLNGWRHIALEVDMRQTCTSGSKTCRALKCRLRVHLGLSPLPSMGQSRVMRHSFSSTGRTSSASSGRWSRAASSLPLCPWLALEVARSLL